MARSVHWLLAASLIGFGCGSCGDGAVVAVDAGVDLGRDLGVDLGLDFGVDGGADAGLDGGVDASPDGGPDPDTWWTSLGPLNVEDDTACEPWGTVAEPLARGLPSDPTPRVLWRHFPPLDPSYDEAFANFRSVVDDPIVSPDGTIWYHGPDFSVFTQLDRDGRILRMVDVTNRWGPTRHRFVDAMVAPDGRLVVVRGEGEDDAGSSDHSDIIVVGPDASGYDHGSGSEGPLPFRTNLAPILAVGAGGRTVVANTVHVASLCDTRTQWMRSVEYHHLPPGSAYPVLQSEGVDGFWYYASGDRVFRLAADGTSVDAFAPGAEGAKHVSRQLLATTPENQLWMTLTLDGFQTVIATDDDRAQRWESSPNRYRARAMSPTNVIHLWTGRPDDQVSYDVNGTELQEIGWKQGFQPASDIWTADGGWITTRSMDAVPGVRRFDSSGNELWRVDARLPGGGLSSLTSVAILDDQGVLYVMAFRGSAFELVAVQTDALPPTRAYCVQRGCNPHQDGWRR